MKDNHKPNHRCLACGKEYYACDSCDKKISKTWRTACCTEGHYRAYYAMWQYAQKQIGIEDARDVLRAEDALSWENAPGRALIEEIMGVGAVRAAEEPAGEPEKAQAEEPEDEPKEPEDVEKPAAFQGKKKKRR